MLLHHFGALEQMVKLGGHEGWHSMGAFLQSCCSNSQQRQQMTKACSAALIHSSRSR